MAVIGSSLAGIKIQDTFNPRFRVRTLYKFKIKFGHSDQTLDIYLEFYDRALNTEFGAAVRARNE